MSPFYSAGPIISVKLTLYSVSRGSQFSSINHTSINENSVFVVRSIVNECGEIFINCSNCLFGTKVSNTFDAS